jgi:hypothetical protein
MSDKKSLIEVFNKHKTDKGFYHFYEKIYEYLLEPFVSKPCTLLEFGIHRGYSIRAWQEYLPLAKIIGVDKKEKYSNPAFFPGLEKRVELKTGKQEDVDFLKSLIKTYNSFDIIIDDSSHMLEFTKITFETLWSSVNPGGIYVIEDLEVALKTIEWINTRIYSEALRKTPCSFWTIWAGELVAFKKI